MLRQLELGAGPQQRICSKMVAELLYGVYTVKVSWTPGIVSLKVGGTALWRIGVKKVRFKICMHVTESDECDIEFALPLAGPVKRAACLT